MPRGHFDRVVNVTGVAIEYCYEEVLGGGPGVGVGMCCLQKLCKR